MRHTKNAQVWVWELTRKGFEKRESVLGWLSGDPDLGLPKPFFDLDRTGPGERAISLTESGEEGSSRMCVYRQIGQKGLIAKSWRKSVPRRQLLLAPTSHQTLGLDRLLYHHSVLDEDNAVDIPDSIA
jgi:hypothetical protein